MAARLNPKHDARTRDKIKVSQLVNLLMQDAFGEVKLEDGRRRSIEILLRKALPDLSAVEMAVDHVQPYAKLPAVMPDAKAWTAAFDPNHRDTEH